MLKDHQRVHHKFKLNGASLKELAFTLKNKNSLIENKSLASFLFDWLNDNDQITLKTSGTTGSPKKIKVNITQIGFVGDKSSKPLLFDENNMRISNNLNTFEHFK